jgi:hypothetical protein
MRRTTLALTGNEKELTNIFFGRCVKALKVEVIGTRQYCYLLKARLLTAYRYSCFRAHFYCDSNVLTEDVMTFLSILKKILGQYPERIYIPKICCFKVKKTEGV